MRSLRQLLVVLALVGVVSVWSPAGALASGCNGSAGDSQYVDPLQNCNPSGSTHSGGSSGGQTSPSTTSTPTTTPTSPVTATTASTTTTTTTTTSSAKDPKSGKSLPFTGLALGPALIVAVTLLGGGLLLRRAAGAIR